MALTLTPRNCIGFASEYGYAALGVMALGVGFMPVASFAAFLLFMHLCQSLMSVSRSQVG